MRVLLVARRSARQQRIQTLNQLRHVIFCAPEPIRSRFKDRYKTGLVSEVAKLRPRTGSDPITHTTLVTMRGLARRIQMLNDEIRVHDQQLTKLVTATARIATRLGWCLRWRNCGHAPVLTRSPTRRW
jgi:tRNA A37 N6-isopentenylltransferase MiaA